MRQSIRSLARAPGFSLFIVAILAVTIGANAAVYTLVDRVLLRPFSYPNLSRLVEITGVAPVEFEVWRGRVAVFERAAIWRISRVLLTSVPEPDNLSAFEVGPDLFDTLGVHARLGRTFAARDHQPDANPTVVISDRLWRRQFASDPAIAGRQIMLDGQAHTVVGVMGPDFLFTNAKVELWQPLRIPVAPETGLKRHFSGVALLPEGVDMASARRQFGAVVSGTPTAPGVASAWHGELRPFTEQFTKPYRDALLACQGAIGLVLLIACANAGGLLLVRNTGRAREFAVRASLGAGRVRIAAQVTTESLILSGCAALAGVPIALTIVRLLLALWPAGGTAIDPERVTIAAPALAWTFSVAVVAALLCSLAPCVHVLRSDPFEPLKSGPGSSPRGSRIRSLLVAVEVGLAIVLVAGAGLMLASLNHLLNVRLGFEPEHVLTARVGIPAQFSTVAEKSAYYTRIVDAIRPIPGVRSAAVVTMLPFGGYMATMRPSAEGLNGTGIEHDPDAPVFQRSVSPDYFRTVGIRVLDGRTFDDRDTVSSSGVAVINKTLAGQFWNRTNVSGLRIALRPGEWLTVIGVVEDAKSGSLTAKPEGELYLPYTQNMLGAQVSSLVVRTSVPPLTAAPSLQRSIHAVNPDQPVSEVKAMAELVREAAAQPRLHTSLLVAFAVFAMLLALGGVFATATYTVAQRSREIAVRAALGAEPAALFRWSMASTLRPVAWGTGAGLIGAVWSSRLLEAELFSVQPHDPVVLAGAAMLLIAVALAAAVAPAWRASRIHPAGVLRTE